MLFGLACYMAVYLLLVKILFANAKNKPNSPDINPLDISEVLK